MIPQLAPGRESAHRSLPFIRIVFCLGQRGDIRFPVRQYDWIEELLIPRHGF